MKFRGLLCVPLILLAGSAVGEEAAHQGGLKHLGVGTCASSVCHGKISPQAGRDVALNEYRIWSRDDLHARAFRVLSNQQSQSIAAKLGLPNAATARMCLDCHADNVPAAQRGPKFQLTDGVSCEACHGGAEKWVETHTQKSQTHRDNIARGMYPTEQPLRRAELCLSCHMGSADKFTSHVILAAGHPRLRFELQLYTFNQPAHFIVDEDYIARKGQIAQMNLWVTGQIENARRYLELLQSRVSVPESFLPELAVYECFACHHPTDKLRWTHSRAGAGIQPGTLRLQRYGLIMIQAITEVLSPGEVSQLTGVGDALVRAGQKDVAAIRAEAQKAHAWVDAHSGWAVRAYTPAEIAKIRKTLLQYSAADKASDFTTAEQVVMGVDSLSYALGDHDRHKAALDSLFGAVRSASAFDPVQFSAAAREAQAQF